MSSNISPRSKPRTALRKARVVAPADQRMSFGLVQEQSPERQELESSIKCKFESVYSAQLTHFLPHLLNLKVAEELGAVAGIRLASAGALFLEQYLDSPVEQSIAGAFRTPVDRNQIVEIGNLAANIPGLAYPLFAILATVLSQAGYRWVACTATPQVASMLAKMAFSSQTICGADPTRLAEGSADWGDYYASRPQVIVGDVRNAAAQVSGDRELALLVRQFARPIARMAASLRKATS